MVIAAAGHSGGLGFDPGGRPPWGGFLWLPSPSPGEYRGGATTSRPQLHTFLPSQPYSSPYSSPHSSPHSSPSQDSLMTSAVEASKNNQKKNSFMGPEFFSCSKEKNIAGKNFLGLETMFCHYNKKAFFGIISFLWEYGSIHEA